MTLVRLATVLLLAPLLGLPVQAEEESFELFGSIEQRAAAVSYNVDKDEFLVVGQLGQRLASRRVRRAASGRLVADPPVPIDSSHYDPALAFAPDANRYLVSGPGFRVLFATGVEDVKALGRKIERPAPGGRIEYLPGLQRWVALAGRDNSLIDGWLVDTGGDAERLRYEDLPGVEYGWLGDFDLAADADGTGFFLAWGRKGSLYWQHHDLEARSVGSRVVLAAGDRNRNVAIQRGGDDGAYLAVWENDRRIFGRVVHGEELGPVRELTDRSTESFLPVIGYNPIADRYLVAWTEQEVDEDVRARWVGAGGRPAGASFSVASGPAHQLFFDHNSVACSERRAECLVTWNEGPFGGPASSIRGRLVPAW